MFGGGKTMNESAIDKRFHLDEEIRELLAFAFQQYGMNGLKYVPKEIDRIVDHIEKEETTKKLV